MLHPSEEADRAFRDLLAPPGDDATTTTTLSQAVPVASVAAPAHDGATPREELDTVSLADAAFVAPSDGPNAAPRIGEESKTTSFPHAANTAMTDLSTLLFGSDAGTCYATLCEGHRVPLGIRLRVALDVLGDLSRRGVMAIASDEMEQALSIRDVHLGADGVAGVRGKEWAHGGAELLWEVLAGEVLRGAPPPLSTVAPDVPRSIVEVVERALAGEMLFTADVLEPFAHAAAALAADREDVQRVVAVPAALPSQRPPPAPDAEAPIDIQRAVVLPALAAFTRSQLHTRPAPELAVAEARGAFRVPEIVGHEAQGVARAEVEAEAGAGAPTADDGPAPGVAGSSGAQVIEVPASSALGAGESAERVVVDLALAQAADVVDGDVVASGLRPRRSSRPARVLVAMRGAPPAAVLATRRHVEVPVLAITAVADDRTGGVRSLAAVHRSVHAPTPRGMLTRAALPAMAAAALLGAAVAWLPRAAPTGASARAGVQQVASPVRMAAMASLGAPLAGAESGAAVALAAAPLAGTAEGEAAGAAGGGVGPGSAEAGAAAAGVVDGAAEMRRGASGSGARPEVRGDPAERGGPAPRPGATRAAVLEAALATRGNTPAAIRRSPNTHSRTERPVHEGVVDPGY